MIKINEKSWLSSQDVWDIFSKDLINFARKRLHNDDIVNDVIQEIFLKIHLNIDSLKDISKIRSWVYQIARNAIFDYFRSEKKARMMIEQLQSEEKDYDQLLNTSINEILKYCMNYFIMLLPEKYKEAIIFTDIEGNTQTALAKKEDISISAAKSRVQRSREMILKMLLEYYHTIKDPEKKLNIDFLAESCPFCK